MLEFKFSRFNYQVKNFYGFNLYSSVFIVQKVRLCDIFKDDVDRRMFCLKMIKISFIIEHFVPTKIITTHTW